MCRDGPPAVVAPCRRDFGEARFSTRRGLRENPDAQGFVGADPPIGDECCRKRLRPYGGGGEGNRKTAKSAEAFVQHGIPFIL